MTKKQTKEIPISYCALTAIKDLIWLADLYVRSGIASQIAVDMYYEAIAVLRAELGAGLDKDV